jgi:hypothetical protein
VRPPLRLARCYAIRARLLLAKEGEGGPRPIDRRERLDVYRSRVAPATNAVRIRHTIQ